MRFEVIVGRIREMFPEIDWDVGTFIHFIYGFITPVLGLMIGDLPFAVGLFTTLFVLKQLLDVYGGEVPRITGGDIAEFTAGLIAGLILVAAV